jgi:hypothetical protein
MKTMNLLKTILNQNYLTAPWNRRQPIAVKTLLGAMVFVFSTIPSISSEFVEGDACIRFDLNLEVATRLQNGDPLIFDIGGGSLLIEDKDGVVRKQLISAYRRYRSCFPEHLVYINDLSIDSAGNISGVLDSELDYLVCYVYNKDYPLCEKLIGFKYNENRAVEKDSGNHGIEPTDVSLLNLVGEWMYKDDFLLSKTVKPLLFKKTKKGVVVSSGDICIVIVSINQLMKYSKKPENSEIQVTRISGKTISRYLLQMDLSGCLIFEEQNGPRELVGEFGGLPRPNKARRLEEKE